MTYERASTKHIRRSHGINCKARAKTALSLSLSLTPRPFRPSSNLHCHIPFNTFLFTAVTLSFLPTYIPTYIQQPPDAQTFTHSTADADA
ncbi:hypothetical protein DTO164E3_2938 [Paecilomyces variotii]|nr:hypothetical protein DTO164E3_2938 [Paecilomyces variotii]KAJ9209064.1 hypothetical protein DTO032I3_281 [Paecilomyces variotii]KAJ9282944.1 hypothetical protein DTO021D3_281 [Paecilomyces variotii]KAJ9343850.1 hypothetical protein DTO027B6_3675 [Paecilomyces variotii]KAJ9386948.1 hypothetical protein DTO032I4_3392 [Paecilomyces variotii]